MNAGNGDDRQLELYWRPGCGFCMGLRRGLDRLGIDRVEHDIWQSPDDAAVVRRHAGGNETVPTVVLGEFALVNPSPGDVVELLAAHAPELLPDGVEAPQPGPVGRFVDRVFGS